MTTRPIPAPNGIRNLPATNPFLDADGNPINFVKVEDMQSAIIALANANTGRGPVDYEVIGYLGGNLIWTTGGGGTSTAGQPFGLLLAITKAA